MTADRRSLVHKSLMGIATTIRSLGIEKMNVDLNRIGHLTRKRMHLRKVTLMIGITIQGIAMIHNNNMDIFLRIALGHILEVTIKHG